MTEPATEPATLVTDAIPRPDEPRHFMVIRPAKGRATARVGDTVVASSERAVVVKEVGRDIYEPVLYFPAGDVRSELLRPVDKTTYCPLKGTASYYDFDGDPSVAGAAWSYQRVLDFDSRLTQLESRIAFDTARVSVELIPEDSSSRRSDR